MHKTWTVRLGCSFVPPYRSKITTNKMNATFCMKEEKNETTLSGSNPFPSLTKQDLFPLCHDLSGTNNSYHSVSIIGLNIRKLGGILTLIFFHLIQNQGFWMEDVFVQLFSCGEERKAKSKALIQSRFYCDLFSLEPPPPSFLHFVNQFGKNFTGWFWKNWLSRSSQEIWVTNHLPN